MNFNQIAENLRFLLGIHDTGLINIMQFSLRALVIFALTLIMVRIASKRLLGKNAAFDAVLIVLLGSTLSRAINGRAPFVETILASSMLIFLHWLLTVLSFHFQSVAKFAKGKPTELVENGKINWKAMKKSYISQGDLDETVRLNGNVKDMEDIKEARLERSGDISVVHKK